MTQLTCPKCQERFSAAAVESGQPIRCPSCRAAFRIAMKSAAQSHPPAGLNPPSKSEAAPRAAVAQVDAETPVAEADAEDDWLKNVDLSNSENAAAAADDDLDE